MNPVATKYRMPAEWEPHQSVWLAWPSAADLWLEDLLPAQEEFHSFCEAIADIDPKSGVMRGERLNVLVPDVESGSAAEKRLAGLPVSLHLIPFGDIWLRDTAPLFLKGEDGSQAALTFKFNGWGGKYDLPHDPQVAGKIVERSKLPSIDLRWICEGGSLEVDGEGTCLTTRQCLLNENRNPGLSQAGIEALIKNHLGVRKIIWIDEGLINDHTDGHIDTIARFVAPGQVLVHHPSGEDDPNRDILLRIQAELEGQTDAKGRKLEIKTIPSPGAVYDEEGELMPASYLNFYIGNSTVVVPTYGSPSDQEAVQAIGASFPNRRTIGIPAKAILTGGGAFHCISQQQPL